MNNSVYFSSRVIDTVKALPESERSAISAALASEYILGVNPDDHLTPYQSILYTMIRAYVERDMLKRSN